MSTIKKFYKQPAEIRDYDVDYEDWFSTRLNDSPLSATATAEAGITVVGSPSIDGFRVKTILSGGTDGEEYKVTVQLTTVNGLVKEADFLGRVKEL